MNTSYAAMFTAAFWLVGALTVSLYWQRLVTK